MHDEGLFRADLLAGVADEEVPIPGGEDAPYAAAFGGRPLRHAPPSTFGLSGMDVLTLIQPAETASL